MAGDILSGGLACAEAGGPGPLEVVASEPSGDVDDLSDEVEAAEFAALEGACVELVGGDAADGDLCLGVALCAGRGDGPGMEVALEVGEGGVGGFGGFGGGGMEAQPAVGETLRQGAAKGG